MDEKFGVETLKTALRWAFNATKQVSDSSADGWQWTDGFSFVDDILALPGIIKDGNLIKDELLDLSPGERNELNDWVKQNFNLPENADIEMWVEDLLEWLFVTLSLVNKHRS